MVKCCWIGSHRYTQPLDATSSKKFKVLKALGEVFVISFSNNYLFRQFSEYAHFYLLPQLPIPILRYIELLAIAPFLALWLIFTKKVQILIAQSPHEGLAAAWAKQIAGCFGRQVVLVVESHGDFEESLFLRRHILLPAFYCWIMNLAARHTLNQADIMRAVSNSTSQQLEKWKPNQHIFQFVTWTDIDVFQQVGKEREDSFSSILLYAGVIIPRKGVINLVNAFATIATDFPQARLKIVGKEDNPTYTAEVKERVRNLELNDRVEFIPGVLQQQLAQLMGEASIFVFPSYSEGLPRVVFEAMSTGLPIIATSISGIPEVVQDGITGFLIEPGDEKALADKIRWCLENSVATQETGRKAYTFASTFFSTDMYVQGYREIFESAQKLLSKTGGYFENSSV